MPESAKFALMTSVSKYSVEEVGDRHRPEAQGQRHFLSGETGEFLAEIKQLAKIARLEAGGIGRGAHQQRLDEAALPCDVARIAVVGLGVALGEAGEFAAMRIVVAVVGEIVAVAREHRAAFIGDHLQAEARQLQIAHDLGPEQRADIGAVGVEKARRQLAAGGRTADPVVLLDHQHVEPGALQIAGVDQPVVAAADDDRVPCLHVRSTSLRPPVFGCDLFPDQPNLARVTVFCPAILNECSTNGVAFLR